MRSGVEETVVVFDPAGPFDFQVSGVGAQWIEEIVGGFGGGGGGDAEEGGSDFGQPGIAEELGLYPFVAPFRGQRSTGSGLEVMPSGTATLVN